MKRVFFCLLTALMLCMALAQAEDDGLPKVTDQFDDERFSIVEEGETRLLRYERKRGGAWETVWENDAILPDGEMGWIYITAYGSGDWQTEWFTREAGPQVSIFAGWDPEQTEHEDFDLTLEKRKDGNWNVVIVQNNRADLYAWLFEDCVLFCDRVPDIAKGVCEEAPDSNAATFDPAALQTMEERLVPYDEPAEDDPIAKISRTQRFHVVQENGKNLLRLEHKRGGAWETVWENDAILPGGDFGWISLDFHEERDGVETKDRFSRRIGSKRLYVYATYDEDSMHEDFMLTLSCGGDDDWRVETYCAPNQDIFSYLFDDRILFNTAETEVSSLQAAGLWFEAIDRSAATFDSKALKAAFKGLKKAMKSAVRVEDFADLEPLYAALNEKQFCPVYARPSADSPRAANGKAEVSLSDWLILLAREGDWAFVLYETKPGQYRTGWIEGAQNEKLEQAVRMTKEATYREAGLARVVKKTALVSDPVTGSGVIGTLKAGTELTHLCWMTAETKEGCDVPYNVYVEVELDGQTWRGFVKGANLGGAESGEKNAKEGVLAEVKTGEETKIVVYRNSNGRNLLISQFLADDKIWHSRWENENLLPDDEFDVVQMEYFEQGVSREDIGLRTDGRTLHVNMAYYAERGRPGYETFDLYIQMGEEDYDWSEWSFMQIENGLEETSARLYNDATLIYDGLLSNTTRAGLRMTAIGKELAEVTAETLQSARTWLAYDLRGAPSVYAFHGAEPKYLAPVGKGCVTLYAAPDAESAQIGEADLSAWMILLGKENGWLMTLVPQKDGYCAGWVKAAQSEALSRAADFVLELYLGETDETFETQPAAVGDVPLLADPIDMSGEIRTIPAGTPVRPLAFDFDQATEDVNERGGPVYVEVELDGQTWRGFVRPEALNLDEAGLSVG